MGRQTIDVRDLERFLQGDLDAVRLVADLYQILHCWDDLVDRDRDVSDEQINTAFWTVLCELPANPFYLRYQQQLTPILRNILIDWIDSTALERDSGSDGMAYAYGLRASLATLVSQCAWLIGGYGWMRDVSMEIRAAVINAESFGEYKQALKMEVLKRESLRRGSVMRENKPEEQRDA